MFIPAVEVQEHVVDVAVDIHVVFHHLVVALVGNHVIPGRFFPLGNKDPTTTLHHVVVFFLTSKVGRHEVSVRTFHEMELPVILSVQIDVHEPPSHRKMPFFKLPVKEVAITNINSSRVGIVAGENRIVASVSEKDLVEAIDSSLATVFSFAKEIKLQALGTIL